MKKFLMFVFMSLVSQSLLAGPFVASGNGVMSLIYCNNENGDFGADVKRDINGNIFGYSWTSENDLSPVVTVKITQSTNPGTPIEKPMIFQANNFKIKVFMGNLPGEVGAPVYRVGEVWIKKNGSWLKEQTECTLFGIE